MKTQSGGDRVSKTDTAPHDYSCSVSSTRQSLIQWGFSNGGSYSGTVKSCFGGPSFLPIPWSDNDELNLLNKLVDEVRGGHWNAGVALGEARESFSMIRQSAGKITHALSALRKRDFGRIREVLGSGPRNRSQIPRKSREDLSAIWLEYRYGWSPLLKDVQDAAKHLGTLAGRPATSRFFAREEVNTGLNPNSSWRGSNVTARRREQAIVYLTETPSLAQSLALTDPLTVAWELVPYSFVADWFIPVGSYLQAWEGLRILSSGTCVRTSTEVRSVEFAGFGDYQIHSGPGGYSTFELSMQRKVGGFTVPLPKPQPLREIASLRHAVDAVALLVQRFSSSSRGSP